MVLAGVYRQKVRLLTGKLPAQDRHVVDRKGTLADTPVLSRPSRNPGAPNPVPGDWRQVTDGISLGASALWSTNTELISFACGPCP